MTKWRFNAAHKSVLVNAETTYFPLFGGNPDQSDITTEANAHCKFYLAYTVSALRARCSVFADGPGNVAFRDDGASSSNLAISITASGWAEDVTGSDTPAADSLCNLIVSTASHGDSLTVNHMLLTYEHASTLTPMVGVGSNGQLIDATRYFTIGTADYLGTDIEAVSKYRTMRATTFNNLRVYCVSVSTPTVTVAIGNDGVSSSAVTASPSASGAIEDVTGTEVVASGHDANIRVVRSAGSITTSTIQATHDAESGIWGIQHFWAATTRTYASFGRDDPSTTPDDSFTARVGSISIAKLQCYLNAGGAGTRDVKVRVGSSDSSNLVIDLTGVSGYLEDVTGSEAVTDTQHVGRSWASSGDAFSPSRVALELPSVVAAIPVSPPFESHQPRMIQQMLARGY